MTRLIEPPRFRDLLGDPVMRKVILTSPRMAAGSARVLLPWRVWGIRAADDKWAGKKLSTYREAFELVKKMLNTSDKYRDAVITCLPQGFAPPSLLELPAHTAWCAHCRRPTVYQYMTSHAAMRKWPAVGSEPVKRCWYCAARKPNHDWYTS